MNHQERYIAHQAKKKLQLQGKYEPSFKYTNNDKKSLSKIMINRHSSRIFNGQPITDIELQSILTLVDTSPSSCDRKGILYDIITEREDKEILSGLLVGGVGWINRADKIILLKANLDAYKAIGEQSYMPYLDTGTIIQSFYLASEVMGLKICFVNPNIRDKNKIFFKDRFLKDNELYCGAIILGK